MKNKILILFCLIIIFSFSFVRAETCSKNGYTILTINGIFTNENGAIANKKKLKENLPTSYNNQPVTVNYIYNPTHLAGAGDLVDVVRQGLFDPKSDYDLVEMLNDASSKVKTQKLLVVGHSQGNFYANNFYNKIVDKDGGVPASSIGVYSVATPDKYVAGNGRYLTSDSDSVIAATVGRLKNILEPNTHIELQKIDGNGHSFSDVYLKYRSERVVADIKYSFDKLKTNTVQNTQDLCISPQKITALHKIVGVTLAAADYTVDTNLKIKSTIENAVISTAKFAVNTEVKVVKYIYNSVVTTAKSLASTFVKLGKSSLALVNFSGNKEKEIIVSAEETQAIEPAVISPEKATEENKITDIPTLIPPVIIQPEIITPPVDIPVLVKEESHSGGGGGSSGGSSNPEVVVIPDPIIPDPVILDTTKPTITFIGEGIMTVKLGDEYKDAGVTVTDDREGMITLTTVGEVNISLVGIYNIVYTATDVAKNSSSLTRIVNVVEPPVVLVASTSAQLSIPLDGFGLYDGVSPNTGKRDYTTFTFQIAYMDSNNNAPQSVKLNIKNITTGIYLPPVVMTQISPSPNILNDGRYSNGELFTTTSTYGIGEYSYDFIAYDKDGNFTNKIIKSTEDLDLKFVVDPSTYVYIPKYSFGVDDQGRDWQVWSFDGSYVYDWSDTYTDNYLREEFKIKTGDRPQLWCNLCLERGIFKHDPKEGYETSDVYLSSFENSPQNKADNKIYQVVIQWDPLGYTSTMYKDSILYATERVNVSNMNNNFWVGWDRSQNHFTTFPAGEWRGTTIEFDGKTGGSDMILKPYAVYDPLGVKTPEPLPTPNPNPTPILSSQKNIISFNFEGVTSVVNGVIDNTARTVNLTVPYDTDISKIIPKIVVSEKANILPNSLAIQNFTNPFTYVVTAEDKTEQSYIVSFVVEPKPTPPPAPNTDNDLPTISSYTINGNQNSVTLNPLVEHVTIVVNSNKNVNWKSIQIENELDPTLDKTFLNSSECVDNTKTCTTKPWDGTMPNRLLLNGNYKIKVHMVDLLPINGIYNDYSKYLDSNITVIGQSH